MRILMISDVYFPRVNGVSTSIKTFREELIRQGHQVTLVAPDYGGPANDDPDTIRIPARGVIGDPEDRMMHHTALRRFQKGLHAGQFDLVHIQTPFVAHYAGVNIAKQLKLPCLVSYHTLFEEYLYHYIPYLPKALLRYVARHFTRSQCKAVNTIIAPSQPMRHMLLDYGVTGTIEVLPTGMRMEQFKNADGTAFRRRHGIAQGRPVLVHVGRIAHEKNIDFLIRVVEQVRKQLPDILLIIAGEGPALKHIKTMVHRLNLEDNVLFVGYLSRDRELLDCYQAGDIFVFASKTETQGLVLLEAMALGTPVVSLSYLGTRDILSYQRGALIATDTVDDFSSKVISLLRNPDKRSRLGEEGKRYATEWSAERLAEKLAALYRQLIKSECRHT